MLLLFLLLLLFHEALKATDNNFELDSLQMEVSAWRAHSLKNPRVIWNSFRFKKLDWLQNLKCHSRCLVFPKG